MTVHDLRSSGSPEDPTEIDDSSMGSWLVQTVTEHWFVDLQFRRLIWVGLRPRDQGAGTPEKPHRYEARSIFDLVDLVQCQIGKDFIADVSFLHLERHRIHLEPPVLAIIRMEKR